MLTSLALLLLSGLVITPLMKKLHLPGLVGMLALGILFGPFALNLLDPKLLAISADLRQLALIIILLRAGLALDLRDLKAVGRPALFLCFIPASLEIMGMILLAPLLFGISRLDAAIMGAVVAAVSPAVVVPRMLHLMDHGIGTEKRIPQMIMAGASADDVFVIVLFTALTGLARGQAPSALTILLIPVSIVLGISAGYLAGAILSSLFKRIPIPPPIQMMILLSAAFLLVALEGALENLIPLSGLIGVMAMGMAVQRQANDISLRLSSQSAKLWVPAEILLFMLVGVAVDIRYALGAGTAALLAIGGALIFRMAGVWLSLIKTELNLKERLFCVLAYCPKATVQAAIGPIPLMMGMASGPLILTVAVLPILVTAPLGALFIDASYRKLLSE